MKLVVKKKKKKGCFPNINVCLESRDALVKLEINALTYRDDKEKEHTLLESLGTWKSCIQLRSGKTELTFDKAECGTKRRE